MPDNVPVPPTRAPWQISLWGLLFVVPLLAGLTCLYFLLLQRLDRQIFQRTHELAQRRQELRSKRGQINVLANLAQVSPWQVKWRPLSTEVELMEEWKRQDRLGLSARWEDFRYFAYQASDDQLSELLRRLRPVTVGQHVWRQRHALWFLTDLPHVIPERFPKFREDAVLCLEDLAKSPHADIAASAQRVLQEYPAGETREVAP